MHLTLFPTAVVSIFFNLSFVLEKNDLVHIHSFGESVFTTAVVPKRWGREEREVSEIANYVRNIQNTDFPVNKWIKFEKE